MSTKSKVKPKVKTIEERGNEILNAIRGLSYEQAKNLLGECIVSIKETIIE